MKTLLKNVNISNEIVILLKGIISTFEITLVRKFGATQTLTHVYVVCIYSYTYRVHTAHVSYLDIVFRHHSRHLYVSVRSRSYVMAEPP